MSLRDALKVRLRTYVKFRADKCHCLRGVAKTLKYVAMHSRFDPASWKHLTFPAQGSIVQKSEMFLRRRVKSGMHCDAL